MFFDFSPIKKSPKDYFVYSDIRIVKQETVQKNNNLTNFRTKITYCIDTEDSNQGAQNNKEIVFK